MASIAQPAPRTVLRGKSLLMLVTLVAGHALKHVFNAGFAVLLPEVKASLGLSNAQVGTLSTVRQVTGGLMNVPAGFLSDRYSHRFVRILILCMIGIGIFCFLLGRVPNYGTAILFASLLTASITFWHPAAIGALSRAFHDRRGFVIALHGTGGSVGEVTGPLLAGGLIAAFALTWRDVFTLGMPLAFAVALIVGLALRGMHDNAQAVSVGQYVQGFKRLMTNGPLLLVLATAACYQATQSVMGTFLPVYIREDLGKSPGVVGGYLALAQLAGIVVQPAMGYLGDRIGRKRVLVPSLFGLTLTVFAVYFTTSGTAFVIALGFAGAFLFSIVSVLLATASDLAPRDVQSTLVSLVFGAGVLFSAIAPYIGGIIADAFGVHQVFLYATGIALTSTILALFIKPPRPIVVATVR